MRAEFRFRQNDFQNTILESGADLVHFNRRRQNEASRKVSIEAFHTMAYTLDGFPFVGALLQKNRYILGSLCRMGNSYALKSAYWLYELIANRQNVILSYCSSDRMNTLPAYAGGDWRKLYEAWNHGIH